MTKDKLYEALAPLCSNDRNKVLDDVTQMHAVGLPFRRATNAYFNQRLVLLDVPVTTRMQLIADGSDAEWCMRFKSHILPIITKTRRT